MPKSQLYGGRWKALRAIAQGGQAQVFLATDETGELSGEFALKRLQNLRRRDRFANEIAAIDQLRHPHIVNLVDHSPLAEDVERPFIVMPLATGGDLSARAEAFKGAVEATTTVALQLAQALEAAHKIGVIHRDVKPANILFVDTSLNIWLGDFGICLIRENPRATDDHEVVGPRGGFMAPECEEGGRLEVTPAADVYSLGKVIYYMLSGGRELPRERLDEPGFALEFSEGQRAQFMEWLLRRMICPLDQRIPDMAAVISELEKIRDWQPPATAAMSERAKALLNKHSQKVGEADRIDDENNAAREAEIESSRLVLSGFQAWIDNELQRLAAGMRGPLADCAIITHPDLSVRLKEVSDGGQYEMRTDWRLEYTPSKRRPEDQHLLRVTLCERLPFVVTVREGPRPQLPERVPARDLQFTMMVGYIHFVGRHNVSKIHGFLSRTDQIGTNRIRAPDTTRKVPDVDSFRVQRVMRTFHPSYSQHVAFAASEWPRAMEKMHACLVESTELFVEEISDPSLAAGS